VCDPGDMRDPSILSLPRSVSLWLAGSLCSPSSSRGDAEPAANRRHMPGLEMKIPSVTRFGFHAIAPLMMLKAGGQSLLSRPDEAAHPATYLGKYRLRADIVESAGEMTRTATFSWSSFLWEKWAVEAAAAEAASCTAGVVITLLLAPKEGYCYCWLLLAGDALVVCMYGYVGWKYAAACRTNNNEWDKGER